MVGLAPPHATLQTWQAVGRAVRPSTYTASAAWMQGCCCCSAAQRLLQQPSAAGSQMAPAGDAPRRGAATGWTRDSGKGASRVPDQLARKCHDCVSSRISAPLRSLLDPLMCEGHDRPPKPNRRPGEFALSP